MSSDHLTLQASRREEFVNIKRQIILCMEELDHTPDTSFERDVVCEEEDAFCLSLENIAALQKLLQQVMSLWNMAWDLVSIESSSLKRVTFFSPLRCYIRTQCRLALTDRCTDFSVISESSAISLCVTN